MIMPPYVFAADGIYAVPALLPVCTGLLTRIGALKLWWYHHDRIYHS